MSNNPQGDATATAIDVLNEERAITHPTEAVFGAGRDPGSKTAVMRLLGLRQRPADKGLILIVINYEQLKPHIDDTMPTDTQRETIFSRWPGPVTLVFSVPVATPCWLTGRFDLFAARATDHPLVVALCQAYGKLPVSASVDLSGLLPCRTVGEVRTRFGTVFPVVPGETGGRLNPSEIRDALTGELF